MVTKVSHELELKFELHPDKISGGRRIPRLLGKDLGGPQRVEELESLYFDTPGEKLRENGVSLRIRRDGKRSVQTTGSIHAGRRSAPIRELELELKRGQSSELFRVARELSSAIPGRLTLKSKAEKGYELRNGRTPVAVKAREVELYPGASVAEAFRIIARSCLTQIVVNEAGVKSRD